MADKEIVTYLKDNIRRGHSMQSLRQALLNKGWNAKEIDNAITKVTVYMDDHDMAPSKKPVSSQTPKERSEPRSASSSMGFVEKVKTVLRHPSEFFERVETEDDVMPAFKYNAIVSLVPFVIMGLLFALGISSSIPLGTVPFIGPFVALFGALLAGVFYVASLISTFSSAGITHLFARLFQGQGNYVATYKATIYGATPSILIGMILLLILSAVIGVVGSLIGLLIGFFYSLYLQIKGIAVLHDVSMGRAALIVLILPIILFALLFFFGLLSVLSATAGLQ